MNLLSRTLTGGAMIILGLFLILLPFFVEDKGVFWVWIYGIPVFIIGFFVLLNKKEDKIEQIREKKTKRRTK